MPKKSDAAAEATPPYEELVAHLEDVVERLEGGGLSLEEALAAYEQGVTLAETAQRILDSAEQRIERLRAAPLESIADDD